jgi:hypothetical protein
MFCDRIGARALGGVCRFEKQNEYETNQKE